MKNILIGLAALAITATTTNIQAGRQGPLTATQTLALNLAEDTSISWQVSVDTFSERLGQAYGLEKEKAQQFAEWILNASDLHFVPADLMAALINTESNFRIRAVSWADAVGPAQVIPRVWGNTCQGDLLEPDSNINCGALVLRHYFVRYCKSETWQCALEYYHTGPGKMAMGDAYAQTRKAYVDKVGSNLDLIGTSFAQNSASDNHGRG